MIYTHLHIHNAPPNRRIFSFNQSVRFSGWYYYCTLAINALAYIQMLLFCLYLHHVAPVQGDPL